MKTITLVTRKKNQGKKKEVNTSVTKEEKNERTK